MNMKTDQPYFVIVDADDDANLPTQPDPVPLSKVSEHIAAWLQRYEAQGYYRNARMETVPLNCIHFILEPYNCRPE